MDQVTFSSGALAAAALLASMERTPKASKRCAAWMGRARESLRISGDPLLAARAIELLDRACGACGLCPIR